MPSSLVPALHPALQSAALEAAPSPALVYLATLSATGRRSMKSKLDRMAGLLAPGSDAVSFPWQSLRFQHTQALRTKLAETFAPATSNCMLAALRGTLKACWRLDLMPVEQYQRAADLQPVRGQRLSPGRALPRSEVSALLTTCARDRSAIGRRDAAILSVLFACGLRRAELVGLDVRDWSTSAAESHLVIRAGKGNKSRAAYPNDQAQALLDAWLDARGSEPGPLFCRVRRGDQVSISRLSTQTVADVLRWRCREANIEPIAPHSLRRSFATALLREGVDVGTVQRLMGHANVQTTLRYDHRGEETQRAAASLLQW